MRSIVVELSNELLCLFTAEIAQRDGDHVIPIPDREIEAGTIEAGDIYRIAVFSREKNSSRGRTESDRSPPDQPQPPVEPGEIRYVEIEDIGKQGDGIARVERGYVIIVPGSDIGERVKVEINEVKPNFAIGEILEETFD